MMGPRNGKVAAVLSEIADLLDVQDANPFRVRAYRNASRSIEGMDTEVSRMAADGHPLTSLPGIGEDLAGNILEIVRTGRCALLDRLRCEVPVAVTELRKIEGLGPRRLRTLWQELDIQTPEQLLRAAQDDRIRAVHGFGKRIQEHILESVRARLGRQRRTKLATAAQHARALPALLRQVPGVAHAEVSGSFRRMRESVGDIDILVAAQPGTPVVDRLIHHDEVREVTARGPARATVVMDAGLQVDLRVVPVASLGAALQYFTGSKAHNIALRRLAQEQGLKLNEYGLFEGNQRIAGDTEESIYKALGMDWIPPELREDRGELEAARSHHLPMLVQEGDLRGDLHLHTNASDGRHSVREMALAARQRGYEYLAITEHSRRLAMARGLDVPRLARQGAEIDRLNAEGLGIRILKGIEVDILEDGRLDLPDAALATLDLVVVAIHSSFHLSRERQTERILAALDHPSTRIFAHPTGRLIEEREPYDVDMARIIKKAKARGIALELNAHPQRLDLLDTYCRMAREEGVVVVISSDAHAVHEMDVMQYGVGQARRAWLEKGNVLNTRGLADLLNWL